ncbi:MAG: HEPN domain-containing protein [Bacteroidetes bacterium]|nr:HEPN domain-containing protein [Bacteroidota bacterium]
MQSFRSEFENPVVQQDIIDLEKKIAKFRAGEIDEEKFRSLRLARGVYGQRQQGVQMIRIKIPYGKMTTEQLLRICEVSEEYSIGRLHTTTRQDIQIHYVSLDRTPQLWADLEKSSITLREACGNTVRNITAAPDAGINPNEVFDVAPYAQEMFEYFLRYPVCQEMGRKFKISFSASDKDEAFSYIHDLGFLPKIENGVVGFKVMLAGGLGAQSFHAHTAYEFLSADKIIPYTEAVLRVFDRHGERSKRHKARIKYLLHDLGLEAFQKLVEEEWKAIKHKTYPIDAAAYVSTVAPAVKEIPAVTISDEKEYDRWFKSNVFEQKQKGFFGIWIKLTNGDFYLKEARNLAALVKEYAADDIRITANQGLMLKYVRPEALKFWYNELKKMEMAKPGFNSPADVTSCPGTDTCNLGISDSVHTAQVIEKMIEDEYPELVFNQNLSIKISGCMNSCGQHALAGIGFHGSSMNVKGKVMPALQVLLGGGTKGNGQGALSEKIIKIPSRRALDAVRVILDDYSANQTEGEYYWQYFERQGKNYFYNILKPLGDTTNVTDEDFTDWGHKEEYVKAIGVGECAGVVIDLISTLFLDVEEKLENAKINFEAGKYADAIYHAYSSMVNGAKAMLTSVGKQTNTQHGVINDFEKEFVETKQYTVFPSAKEQILKINKSEPTKEFAAAYIADANAFYKGLIALRDLQLAKETEKA